MGVFASTRNRKTSSDAEYERREPFPIWHCLTLIAITAIAFAVRYWFNFKVPHINLYNACDASEYMRNAQAVLESVKLPLTFWPDSWACLTGVASPNTLARLKAELTPLQDFSISGPVFPLFVAWSYVLAASPFDMQNWGTPIFSQCLISTLTCTFIAMAAGRVFGKASGYVAGLLACVYPAFVLNSDRLYTETFAAFLLSIICYLTVRGFTQDLSTGKFLGSSFILGFTAACLQFTRSVMATITMITIPIIVLQQGWRKGMAALAAFIIGFCVVAAPWLAFQKVAFGSSALLLDRVGHQNFFTGNNTDIGGYLSVPYPDGRGVADKSLQQLFEEAYHKSPTRWWSLQLDKPLRLFLFPWNDTRASVGPITFKQQVLWHQIMLVLAAIGIVLGFIPSKGSTAEEYEGRRQRDPNQGVWSAKAYLLCVVGLHLAYLLFITVPRYNLTAMVVLSMFAGAGVTAIIRLNKLRKGPVAAVTLILSACFLLLIPRLPLVNVAVTLSGSEHAMIGLVVGSVLCFLALIAFTVSLFLCTSAHADSDSGKRPPGILLARSLAIIMMLALSPLFLLHAHATGRWYEWRCPMVAEGQTVVQSFTLPADFAVRTQGRQMYLMVDSDSASGLAADTVTVDGVKLDSPIIPQLAMIDDFARFQQLQPGVHMREIEWIWQCLTNSCGITPSGLRQWFIYVIPNSAFTGKSTVKVQITANQPRAGSLYGAYAVSPSAVLIPADNLASWEKTFYGVENDETLCDPRYDSRLTSLAATNYENMDLSPEPGVQSGRYNIHLLAGPPAAFAGQPLVTSPSQMTEAQVLLSKPIATNRIEDSQSPYLLDQEAVPEFGPGDLWIVRVTGDVRRSDGRAKIATNIETAGDGPQKTYASPWSAQSIVGNDWQHFDTCAPIQPGALPDRPVKITATMQVSPIEEVGQHYTSGTAGDTELRNLNLQILRLPANPLHLGHQVF